MVVDQYYLWYSDHKLNEYFCWRHEHKNIHIPHHKHTDIYFFNGDFFPLSQGAGKRRHQNYVSMPKLL